MKIVLLSMILVSFLTACSQSNTFKSPLPEDMPDDFAFSLQYGVTMANELNTYENTFTKDLISNGTETTEMVLSEEEQLSIYEKFRSVDLLALPTEKDNSWTEPHEKYALKMTADGEEYSLEWSMMHNTKKLNEWQEVMGEIHEEIIFEREEYQELPKVSDGYE